jgi:hypothetical protein
MMLKNMTLKEARRTLEHPRFGDEQQVAAVRFLEACEAALSEMDKMELKFDPTCGDCKGSGMHRCECDNEHECYRCDGKGFEPFPLLTPPLELKHYSMEVLRGAWEMREEYADRKNAR